MIASLSTANAMASRTFGLLVALFSFGLTSLKTMYLLKLPSGVSSSRSSLYSDGSFAVGGGSAHMMSAVPLYTCWYADCCSTPSWTWILSTYAGRTSSVSASHAGLRSSSISLLGEYLVTMYGPFDSTFWLNSRLFGTYCRYSFGAGVAKYSAMMFRKSGVGLISETESFRSPCGLMPEMSLLVA